MTSPAPDLPTPAEAYNKARAVEQKLHQYTANHATGEAVCACGVHDSMETIGDHIEKAAELSGQAAADQARRQLRALEGSS